MRKKWIRLLLAVVLTVTVLAGCAGVKMTLTFEVDGEVYATVNTMGQETVTMPKDPEKEGYTFDGWYWDKDVWGKPFTVNSLLETPLTESMTVYAKWKRIETETETPTYHTVMFKNGDKIIATQQVESGKAATAPTETPTKAADEMCSAYTFTGWDKTFDKVTSDITVNAVFEGTLRVFTVTFKNGAEVFATQEVEYGKSATEPTNLPVSGNANEEFTNWYTDEACTTAFSFGREITANITLYAGYKTSVLNFKLLSDDTYEVSQLNDSTATKVIIPETYREKKVTSIGSSAFSNCSSLTSVVTPDSVTNVGTSAFYGCSSLTSIEIPNSITSIGSSAFSGCSHLTSIEIPDRVTSIGSETFYGCSSLTSIAIPNGVTSIGSSAFSYCSSLTRIEIPKSVTSVSFAAFSDCSNLTTVVIPDNLTSINNYVFNNCSNLTTVVIPDSVTSIGTSAFSYCRSLTSMEIPNSVTSIGSSAFSDCRSLTSMEIPNSVTSIGSSAFSYCSNLTSVVIPDSVTSIGSSAFYSCSSLTSIEIPDSVTSIGSGAFRDCSSLTRVEISEIGEWCGIEFGSSDSNPLNYAKHLYLKGAEVTELVIPEGITSIGSSAFYGYSSLTSVEIPNSVTSIGSDAFSGCSSLTRVVIPNSVTSIAKNAFYDCPIESATMPTVAIGFISKWKLKTVKLTGGESVGSSAFSWCGNLTNVEIHSVMSIGSEAFYECENLTSVVIGNSVTSIGSSAFYSCSSLTSIEIPDSVTSIGTSAFSFCRSLTSVVIPNSVTSIGSEAFNECPIESATMPTLAIGYIPKENLKTVVLGGDKVDNSAFSGCNTIISVVIRNSITSIGSSAFYNCSKLRSIEIPASVISIGSDAFTGTVWYNNQADGLVYAGKVAYNYKGTMPANTTITIKEGTIGVAAFAFLSCNNLIKVIIPDSVINVGKAAFNNCNKLNSVMIGSGIKSIGSFAFNNCNNLTKIKYNGTSTEWRLIKKGENWNYNTGNYTVECNNWTLSKAEA